MAKKADLLKKAQEYGLEVDESMKVPVLEKMIAEFEEKNPPAPPPPAPPKGNAKKKEAVAPNQFTLEGKKYNVLKGATVPLSDGAVKLTPADICVHQEAQVHLVEVGASCIEEVTE